MSPHKNTREWNFTEISVSSNGTFVNGDKLGKANKRIIHDGDELSLVIRNSELAKKRQMEDCK